MQLFCSKLQFRKLTPTLLYFPESEKFLSDSSLENRVSFQMMSQNFLEPPFRILNLKNFWGRLDQKWRLEFFASWRRSEKVGLKMRCLVDCRKKWTLFPTSQKRVPLPGRRENRRWIRRAQKRVLFRAGAKIGPVFVVLKNGSSSRRALYLWIYIMLKNRSSSGRGQNSWIYVMLKEWNFSMRKSRVFILCSKMNR